MKRGILGILLITLLAATGTGLADKTSINGHNFSTTIYLTTDYVSRGISYSNENPAIQGTFDYSHDSGIFAGIWASSWHSGEVSNDLELGYYAGYAGAVGNVNYSLAANYYDYPDAEDDAAEWDYMEFTANVDYTFAKTVLTPTLGVGYAYSPDYFGEDGTSQYSNITLDLALPLNLGLGLEAGYFDIEGDKSTGNGMGLDGNDGYDYYHWRVGLSTTLAGFGMDLSYHDTTEEEYFGDIGGQRVAFTLSRSF